MTPTFSLSVGGFRREVEITAVVDTGFDDCLCLPTDLAVTLGLELFTTADVELADGSIKKGGKELLAVELYKKYTSELNGAPYQNQAFIAILVAQLGMSKAGATTYNYNMKKKFGGEIASKK